MPRGVVKRVIDGNTVQLRSGENVRVAGLEAPKLEQPGGQAAKRRLQGVLRRGTSIGLSDPQDSSGDTTIRTVTKDGKNIVRLLSTPRRGRIAAGAA